MKKIGVIFTLGLLSMVAHAMEIPRGAFLFKDLEKAKAEAIEKDKAICFFVT